MVKKILLLLLLFCLTGCYDYHELTDLAIVNGISISFNDNKYDVSIEVFNSKDKLNEESNFVIYKGNGNSIQEALRNITMEVPKRIYLSHINVLIIDESIAKDHLSYVFDYFIRNPDIRKEFYVLINKNNDFSGSNTFEFISSNDIVNSLRANYRDLGYSNLFTFQDLLSDYLNPYRELAIPTLSIDNKNTNVSGIAIFSKDNLNGGRYYE